MLLVSKAGCHRYCLSFFTLAATLLMIILLSGLSFSNCELTDSQLETNQIFSLAVTVNRSVNQSDYGILYDHYNMVKLNAGSVH